jgi:C4-dicarboxylate-specific signal transduction histidine kinase
MRRGRRASLQSRTAFVGTRVVGEIRQNEIQAREEWEYVRKDGSRVQVLLGSAAFDGTGGSEGVTFVLDLTDVKRAEQALRASDRRYHEVQLRLSDANRIASVAELSASIVHEINQPVLPVSALRARRSTSIVTTSRSSSETRRVAPPVTRLPRRGCATRAISPAPQPGRTGTPTI